jgi:hypothetical protein
MSDGSDQSPGELLPAYDEEVCYLKWDVSRFLREPESELLPEGLRSLIQRFVFWADRRSPRHLLSPSAKQNETTILEDLALAAIKVLNDFTALQGMGKHMATPRERLVENELIQTVKRIDHILWLVASDEGSETASRRSLPRPPPCGAGSQLPTS